MNRILVVIILISGLNWAHGQDTYKFKGLNLSFTSTSEFMPLHSTRGYWVYKSDYFDIEVNQIEDLKEDQLMVTLAGKITGKKFQEIQEGEIIRTKGQTGLFNFLKRKNSNYGYAWGIINDKKSKATVFIQIKFDNRKKADAQKIIKSFFKGDKLPPKNQVAVKEGDQANQSVVTRDQASELAIQQQKEELANKPKPQPKPKKETKPTPKVDVPEVPKKKGPKHPVVNHPNLVKLTAAQKKEFIDAHNKYRSDVGVPPLTWDEDLANYAADWAVQKGLEGCKMQHRPRDGYGENLFWSSGMTFSASYVVNSWGSEINDYHGEVVGQSNAVVGHYTQVVWKKTERVGCAAFKCGSALLVVCNYDPPGNYVGQHPYK